MYAQRKPEGSRRSAPRSCFARGTILEHWPGEFHVSVSYLSSPKSICIPWRPCRVGRMRCLSWHDMATTSMMMSIVRSPASVSKRILLIEAHELAVSYLYRTTYELSLTVLLCYFPVHRPARLQCSGHHVSHAVDRDERLIRMTVTMAQHSKYDRKTDSGASTTGRSRWSTRYGSALHGKPEVARRRVSIAG